MAVDAASVSVVLGSGQQPSEKGQPNGYAGLDSNAQVPLANIPVGAGGPPAWGEVTGTLANQVDLKNALDGKEATGTATAAVAAHAALPDPHPTYALDTDLSTHVGAADPHPTYALDSDLATHVAAADPHTVYALDADLTAHAAAADPHTGYQRETEKGAALGYASLDAGTLVPVAQLPALSALSGAVTDGQIPATIARDTEVATAVSDHAGAADPHTGYQKESEKSAANGYASLGAGTKVPTAELGGAGADGTKFLRGDQTWAAPTASVADPNPQSYTPGSFAVTTGKYVILCKRLQLTTTQRASAAGTARIRIT